MILIERRWHELQNRNIGHSIRNFVIPPLSELPLLLLPLFTFGQMSRQERNCVFVCFLKIPISLQPDGVNLLYLKLRLFDLTELIGLDILGLRHWVAKI